MKEKYNDLFQAYVCGNISVFKEGLNELSKFQLLEFVEFMQMNQINAISVCKRYLENDSIK